MRNLDVNFSSLDVDHLLSGSYRLSSRYYDAYSYFCAEYRHSSSDDIERMVVVKKEKRFSLKRVLSELKDKIEGYDGFLYVSPNSDTYSFINAEYRTSSFSKDINDNYIVPKSEFYKVKTRR
jgi:hypothetical protein